MHLTLSKQNHSLKFVPKLLVQFGLLVTLILQPVLANAQQTAQVSPAGTKYLLYTPPAYSTTTTTYPLLVSLHGGSSIGDDLTKLTTGTPHQMPAKLISQNQWPSTIPFIVVSPQLKRDLSVPNQNDQEWPASYINEVIEYVRTKYRIDASRIYITGISLGGAGTWNYAATYPSKVAAIIPISGKSNLTQACAVKNIPVWAFHGEYDGLVKAKFSIDMINAISSCQPTGIFKPRLNLLALKGHEGWNEVYNQSNGYKIYDWLLQFRKNNTANKLPYVNAGADKKIVLRTSPLSLLADVLDTDGTIATIAWTQTSGASLTLANTNSAMLKISNLKTGTFELQATVTDNKGGKSSDKILIQIVDPSAPPAITNLVLMNGKTNTDIGNITEGQVIKKSTTLTEINIRALVTTGVGSVKFSINNDQNVRVVNSPGPYLITKQLTSPEWTLVKGEYLITAIPFPQSGARGTPGISQTYKIVVTESTTTASRVSIEPVIYKDHNLLVATVDEGNQWIFNGQEIEGATGHTFSPTDPGVYKIRSTRGISNEVVVNERDITPVTVFPNPSTNFLRLNGIKENVGRLHYSILKADGTIVQSGEVGSTDDIILNGELPKGIYTLLLKHNTAKHQVKFFVE